MSATEAGDTEEESPCVICFEPIEAKAPDSDKLRAKPANCVHQFHYVCIRTWYETGTLHCPLCRASFDKVWVGDIGWVPCKAAAHDESGEDEEDDASVSLFNADPCVFCHGLGGDRRCMGNCGKVAHIECVETGREGDDEWVCNACRNVQRHLRTIRRRQRAREIAETQAFPKRVWEEMERLRSEASTVEIIPARNLIGSMVQAMRSHQRRLTTLNMVAKLILGSDDAYLHSLLRFGLLTQVRGWLQLSLDVAKLREASGVGNQEENLFRAVLLEVLNDRILNIITKEDLKESRIVSVVLRGVTEESVIYNRSLARRLYISFCETLATDIAPVAAALPTEIIEARSSGGPSKRPKIRGRAPPGAENKS